MYLPLFTRQKKKKKNFDTVHVVLHTHKNTVILILNNRNSIIIRRLKMFERPVQKTRSFARIIGTRGNDRNKYIHTYYVLNVQI